MNNDDQQLERDEPEEDRRPRRRRRDEDEDLRAAPKRSSTGMIIGIVLGVGFAMQLVIGGLIALLLPAVKKLREAAARSKNMNNMKMIGLAKHSVHDTVNGMMGPNAVDGRTGEVYTNHSWRTGMLPYMEQDSLYRGIDMKQPWDAARNAQFTSVVVPQFRDISDANQATTATPYRVFVGGGAVFNPDGNPVSLKSISDGTSNTILVVQAFDTVPWAKPQELNYSPTAPLPKLGSPGNSSGFMVLVADGSVRFVGNKVSDATLRKLIEKADGQTIGVEEW